MKAVIPIDKLNTEYRVQVRAKLFAEDTATDWSEWLGVPVEGYVEGGGFGPCPIRDVEWIEVNPFVVEVVGRLVKPRTHNYEQQICEALESEKIPFEMRKSVFKIYLH